jgi:hypothetical protein
MGAMDKSKYSPFDYLLNAMEYAAQQDDPWRAGYPSRRQAVLEYVRKLEKVHPEELQIPEGWKLVPLEPTSEMIAAARELRVNLQFGNHGISGPISPFEAKEIYQRMLEHSQFAAGSRGSQNASMEM